MPFRIMLADDHEMVRQGLRALLEREGFAVVGEASNGKEAVQLAQHLRPDVAILDISMPNLNGIDAARELLKSPYKTKTILLTQHDKDQYITEALRAGVRGYVLKIQTASDLMHAVTQVCNGNIYLSPNISGTVVGAFLSKAAVPANALSPRERQVLQLVSEGKSTKEIAVILEISIKTAESHRTRLMRKLGIHELASLVRYAIRHGLVQP